MNDFIGIWFTVASFIGVIVAILGTLAAFIEGDTGDERKQILGYTGLILMGAFTWPLLPLYGLLAGLFWVILPYHRERLPRQMRKEIRRAENELIKTKAIAEANRRADEVLAESRRELERKGL